MSWRPDTIAEVARRARDGVDPFDIAVREFIDTWGRLPPDECAGALAGEPAPVGRIEDAYLAALAEHLASAAGLDAPAWTESDARFLREPFFAGGLESLKAMLIVVSPSAFRRRLIFIDPEYLARPHAAAAADEVPAL